MRWEKKICKIVDVSAAILHIFLLLLDSRQRLTNALSRVESIHYTTSLFYVGLQMNSIDTYKDSIPNVN